MSVNGFSLTSVLLWLTILLSLCKKNVTLANFKTF